MKKIPLSKVFKCILSLLFAVMIVIGICIIFSAFANIYITNEKIIYTLKEISNYSQNPTVNTKLDDATMKGFIERLSFASKGIMDASTISFLFQMFTIALV